MRMIDADALIEFIDVGHLRPPAEICFSERDVKNLVDKQPTIEPKKGKWIDMGDFEQCSACTGTHLKEVNTVYGKAIWIKSAYCPNCGADMRDK